MVAKLLQRWPMAAVLLAPRAWTLDTGLYLACGVADYVVMNLGQDAAMVAFMFS